MSDPTAGDKETPYWILSTFDYPGPWGVAACMAADCQKHITQHLKGLETMTWAAILSAAGGKASGTNNHMLPVERLTKKARDRLEELHLDDLESICSLRFENTVRLYGIREGRVFKILWLDPWHHIEDAAVCPGKKHHT